MNSVEEIRDGMRRLTLDDRAVLMMEVGPELCRSAWVESGANEATDAQVSGDHERSGFIQRNAPHVETHDAACDVGTVVIVSGFWGALYARRSIYQ